MVTSPNTQSSYGLMATAVAVAATAAMPKPAALCLRLSLWRSRPGGVVCVERLEVQTAPLLLEVEQMHAFQLMQVGRSMLGPLTADSAQAIRYLHTHTEVTFVAWLHLSLPAGVDFMLSAFAP